MARTIVFFGEPPLGPTASITGTTTASITEADVVVGGKTIIITLAGDTWVASGGTFDAIRQDIINGIDSAQAEGTGWDSVVKAGQGVSGVVRTSATIVTITLDAFATYNITAQETITVTVPSSAVVLANPIVGSPTFTVSVVVSGRISRAGCLDGLGGIGQRRFNPSLEGVG